MKQETRFARRAAALLAAAALPFTPLLAQDAQPPAQPPAPEPAPPPAAEAPPVVEAPPAPAPMVASPAPTAAAPARTAAAPPAASAAAAASRAPARPVRAPAATAAAIRAARAPAIVHVPTTTPSVTTAAPVAATPAPAPEPVAAVPIAPAPATAPDASAPAQPAAQQGRGAGPWILLGLLALAGLAVLLFTRRRRRSDAEIYEERREAPAVVAAPAAVAAAEPERRPWLGLRLEPVRAGVEGEEARVEFALTLDNQGEAPARDVRVSAFMLQAGASEAERALIEDDAAEMPPVTIAAGKAKRVKSAVRLPTAKVKGDAVLPVVVADARYTLPDGSEGRTSASFAVGVPDGEELAHFAVDNPSGLHDEVEARALGEPERA
jgi:hypothetical protein